jgi:tetratricopeptide (TPR) repeat protein
MTLVRAGREAEALALYRDVLGSDQQSGFVYEQYGDVLALAGDTPGAEHAYRKAMEIQPNLTGILLKINALESTHKETPLTIFPILLGLITGCLLLVRRER